MGSRDDAKSLDPVSLLWPKRRYSILCLFQVNFSRADYSFVNAVYGPPLHSTSSLLGITNGTSLQDNGWDLKIVGRSQMCADG